MLGIAKQQHFNTVEEFLAAIGYGGIVLSKIMPRIKDEYGKLAKPKPVQLPENVTTRQTADGIIVEGLSNCLVKLSRCCNPLPGDQVIGFVTRGFGVSVHKKDCPNVVSNMENPDLEGRWVNVRWADNVTRDFKASLRIVSSDRYGLLADITTALSSMRVMIHGINARELKNGSVLINVTVAVSSIEHLKNVIAKIGKISGVEEVARSGA